MGIAKGRTPRGTAAEKEFYLREFRGRTLCIGLSIGGDDLGVATRHLAPVLRELVANRTRALVVMGPVEPGRSSPPPLVERAAVLLGRRLGRRCGFEIPVVPAGGASDVRSLAEICETLRRKGAAITWTAQSSGTESAVERAARLRVAKLVLLEPQGGIRSADGRLLSFMDDEMLSTLTRQGQAEWAGLGARRQTISAVRRALAAGVPAVNLCEVENLEGELFTYEGAGTLFTLQDYCAVEPLGIDDLEEAERLLLRGEREGILKRRTPRTRRELLLQGFGARVGSERHLAGVCALLTAPYEEDRCGEVAGLYTITRFKAEGVGRHLVARLEREGRASGLRYLFACTTNERARAFFLRAGFREVSRTDVPRSKWERYDPRRASRLAILRKDLEVDR